MWCQSTQFLLEMFQLLWEPDFQLEEQEHKKISPVISESCDPGFSLIPYGFRIEKKNVGRKYLKYSTLNYYIKERKDEKII